MSERSLLIDGAYGAMGRGDFAAWQELLDRSVVWRAVDHGPEFETPT